jgi:hypothetical protein
VTSVPVSDDKVPISSVSIEDFIDLDAPPSLVDPKQGYVVTSQTGNYVRHETSVGHGDFRIGLGPAPPPVPIIRSSVIKPTTLRHTPMTSDDEDVELSGDGSGSGDGPEVEDVVTLTQVTATLKSSTVTSPSPSPTTLSTQGSNVKVTSTPETPYDLVVGGKQ